MPHDIIRYEESAIDRASIDIDSFQLLKASIVPVLTARGVKAATVVGQSQIDDFSWFSCFGLERVYRYPRQWSHSVLTGENQRPQSLAYRRPEEDDDSNIVTARELAKVLIEINGLAFQPESDEFGLLRPSYQALTQCMKVMLELATTGDLPYPSDITTDRNGDIRITWAAEGREAELIFPSEESEQPYLYYSSFPGPYRTDSDLNTQSLSKRIHWAICGQ